MPALLSAGCYSYTPLRTAPGTGEEARVRLTELGSATLAPRIGTGVIAIRGRLVAADSASLTLSVVGVTNRQELEDPWIGEKVVVPRQFVSGYDRRNLNLARSALLAGGVVFGGAAIIAGIKLGGDLLGRNGGNSGPGR
ncbi:MAG: hypothetical protein HYX65_11315 [Gemmatimonadetes bacterium]|nr:hypothetical protein [Gemmatimonadota bacterium]